MREEKRIIFNGDDVEYFWKVAEDIDVADKDGDLLVGQEDHYGGANPRWTQTFDFNFYPSQLSLRPIVITEVRTREREQKLCFGLYLIKKVSLSHTKHQRLCEEQPMES
jgi:hypothetical protein